MSWRWLFDCDGNERNRVLIIAFQVFRTSRPEVFCKKDVFRNITKFIGKHLCQSLFFNKIARYSQKHHKIHWKRLVPEPLFYKVAGLRLATLLKEAQAQVFSYEFWKISRNAFFYRTPPAAASETLSNKFKNVNFLLKVPKKYLWQRSPQGKQQPSNQDSSRQLKHRKNVASHQ